MYYKLQYMLHCNKTLNFIYLCTLLIAVYSGKMYSSSYSTQIQMQDDEIDKIDNVDSFNAKTDGIPEDSLLFVVDVNEKQINAIRKHKNSNYTYDSLEQEYGYSQDDLMEEYANESGTMESRPLDTGYFKSLEKDAETMDAREVNEDEETSSEMQLKEDKESKTAKEEELNSDFVSESKYDSENDIPASSSTTDSEKNEVAIENSKTESSTETENTTISNTTPATASKPQASSKKNGTSIPTVSNKSGNYFKIQIAASKKPLPQSILQNIYNGNKKITKELENGWYKYAIGDFDTYQQAFNYTKYVKRKGIFVLGYKSGKKYYPYYSGKNKYNTSLSIKRNASIHNTDSIMYGVQIAAAPKQISDNLLKLLYHGQLTVYESNENTNFKYIVRLTKDQYQAKATLNNIDIPGAFIVKYKNGGRIQ